MVYVVAATKGGVGKSLVSFNVLPLFTKDDFLIYEIDNNNDTLATYENSKVLKDKVKNLKVNDAEDELDLIFYDALANEKDIILDLGGGDDSKKVLEFIKMQPKDNIVYIVPTLAASDIKNLKDTYEMIDDKSKALIVLNGYYDRDDLKKEFLFYFGSEAAGVESFKNQYKTNEVSIPFDHLFNIAKTFKLTLLDLANFADMFSSNEDARDQLLEAADGDDVAYAQTYKKYRNALKAKKLINTIKKELNF